METQWFIYLASDPISNMLLLLIKKYGVSTNIIEEKNSNDRSLNGLH